MTMRKFYVTLLTTTLLAFSAEPAFAEKSNVDDLMNMPLSGLLKREVSVASKREEKVREAPGVVSVIDSEDIKRYGGRTLTDILQRLPSVNIGGGSVYRNNVIVQRGQGDDIDTQNLLLINGRPFRDMVSSGIHAPIYQTFPVDMIDHIEVIRGPGSVLYGTNAFTGVINIVTKTPETSGGMLSGMIGDDNYRRTEFNAIRTFDGGHILASATRTATDGWDFTVSDATRSTRTESLRESSAGGYAQGKYKGFTINAFSGYENQETLGVAPIWPLDTAKNRSDLIDIGYKHDFSMNWSGQANLTYNGHKQIVQDGAAGLNGITPMSDGLLGEFAINGTLNSKTNLLVGLTHEHYNASMKEIGGEYDTSRSSGYMQIDYRPWDPLKLIGGLQINKVQGLDYSTSPRLGAIYNITDKLGVKALYSEAYKAPVGSVTVLSSPAISGNPNLVPEVIKAVDLQVFYEADKFYVSGTYFKSRTTDLMDARFVPSLGKLVYSNGSQVDSDGLEFEGKYMIDDKWEINGSLSFNSNTEEPVQSDAFKAPNTIAKIGGSYRNTDLGLTAGLFYNYFGEPGNTISSGELQATGNRANPVPEAFNLVTLNVGFDLNTLLNLNKSFPKTELTFYGNNLLDEDSYYGEVQTHSVNSMPWQSGRTLYGNLKISF